MTSLKKTLKSNFKTRKRRALSGALIAVMLIVVAVAAIAVVSGQFFDLADTASIVDSIDLTSPVLYSEQRYASIQVKNNGNTPLTDVKAYVLVKESTGTLADTDDCAPGVEQDAIGTTVTQLNPGAATTFSGSPSGCNTLATTAEKFTDRGEYIIQIEATSGDETITKTITIRAR